MNYIISYPRSANSFIRYAIEKLIKRPTLDCMGRTDDLCETVTFKSSVPVLRKEHYKRDIIKRADIDKLILLVRNYKDVFISQNFRFTSVNEMKAKEISYTFHMSDKKPFNSLKSFFQEYYGLLEFYDNFKKDKMLLYYEDIISNNYEAIKKVINFLIPDNNIEISPELITSIKKNAKDRYKRLDGYIKTDEKKILHSILTVEQNVNMDKKFRDYNIQLYDKYLNRYTYV